MPGYPLYLMAKPPREKLPEFGRLRALLGIESNYALDRLHFTLLPLGEVSPALIARIGRIMDGFHAEPFAVLFDHVEGATLKPRKGLRAPGVFQRSLVRHLAFSGFAPPAYEFSLHLNLDYGNKSDRRATIAPLEWQVEEVLLIESLTGQGRHIEHGRWPLFVRQYALAL
jgi:2'-5' RNA ligase